MLKEGPDMTRTRTSLLAAAVAVSLLLAGPESAQAGVFQSNDHRPLTYVGSALATVVYLPVKVVFALGGALASGVVWVATLGAKEPSKSIWEGSVEGDYVVTPSMIEGRRLRRPVLVACSLPCGVRNLRTAWD
jgi:hypothetical protein